MPGFPTNNSKVLTKAGWKSYSDFVNNTLLIGEEILTFNQKTKEAEWVPLIGICKHTENQGRELVLDSGQIIEVSSTNPWIVKDKYRNRETLYTTEDLKNIDESRNAWGLANISNNPCCQKLIEYDLRIWRNNGEDLNEQGIVEFIDLELTNVRNGSTNSDPNDPSLTIAKEYWSPITTNNSVFIEQNGLSFVSGAVSPLSCQTPEYINPSVP